VVGAHEPPGLAEPNVAKKELRFHGGPMPEKSPRRVALERSLAENPDDAFLRYGLAMQCLREGDVEEGRSRLRSLIEDDPDRQIAAYQQLGQSYADADEREAAAEILRAGIAKAQAAGDWHAASEMQQVIDSLA
jgi:predicted Zn-dependent protease